MSAYISAIALARKFYIAHILTRLCDATVAVHAGDEPFNAREWWSGSAEYWSGMAELWSRITIDDQCRQNPARGFTHWASGHLEHLEININNPSYCHVRSNMKPSMKLASYDVYLLLERTKEDMASIRTTTCQCTAGYVWYMYSYTFNSL